MIGNRGIGDQAAAVIEDPGGVADLNGNGKGTGIELVERVGIDWAKVDVEGDGFSLTSRNFYAFNKVEAGFGVIQIKIVQTAHGKCIVVVLADEITGGKADNTGGCADLKTGVKIIVPPAVRLVSSAGCPLAAQGAKVYRKGTKVGISAAVNGGKGRTAGCGTVLSVPAACQHAACGSRRHGSTGGL